MDRKKREFLQSVPKPKNEEAVADEKTTHLPEEIIFNILKWLPPKPLIRFKSVSNSLFNRIITSKSFIDAHTSCSRPVFVMTWFSDFGISLFFLLDLEQISCVRLTHVDEISHVSQSLNGFLFLAKDDGNLLVHNLITKESRDFGRPILPADCEQTPPSNYMFRFDPSSENYKVLASPYRNYQREHEDVPYFVLTLGDKTNTWRKVDQTTGYPIKYYPASFYYLCIDGTIYFINIEEITAFDLNNEKFRHITTLDEFRPPDGRINFRMSQSGKHLGLFEMEKIDRGKTMRMKMCIVKDNKTDAPTWVDAEYRLSLPVSFKTKVFCDLAVHLRWKDGLLLFFRSLRGDNRTIISWNPKTDSCKVLDEVDGLPNPAYYMVKWYVPTLASPQDL